MLTLKIGIGIILMWDCSGLANSMNGKKEWKSVWTAS